MNVKVFLSDGDCIVYILICIFWGELVCRVIKLLVLFNDILVVFWVMKRIKLNIVKFFELKSLIIFEELLKFRLMISCNVEWFCKLVRVKFGGIVIFIVVMVIGVDLILRVNMWLDKFIKLVLIDSCFFFFFYCIDIMWNLVLEILIKLFCVSLVGWFVVILNCVCRFFEILIDVLFVRLRIRFSFVCWCFFEFLIGFSWVRFMFFDKLKVGCGFV